MLRSVMQNNRRWKWRRRDVFMSENYIKTHLTGQHSRRGIMHRAHICTTGGYICGETKVAIALRNLGGGSYLDVSFIFGTSYITTYQIFHQVAEHWFCIDFISDYLKERSLDTPGILFQNVSKDFTNKDRSRGVSCR